jgi:hypothetical protein
VQRGFASVNDSMYLLLRVVILGCIDNKITMMYVSDSVQLKHVSHTQNLCPQVLF